MGKARTGFTEIIGLLQLSLLLLLLPMRWVIASAFAALLHELGHYLAVCLCGGKFRGCKAIISGLKMEAVLPSFGKEIVCILAGPAVGAVAVLLYRWFPMMAVCALGQSVYNILPIYPLDGGRLLRRLVSHYHGNMKVCKYIEIGILTLIFGVALLLMRYLGTFFVFVTGGALLWISIRKTPCKPDDNSI